MLQGAASTLSRNFRIATGRNRSALDDPSDGKASISKSLTAFAIMRLVQNRKISMNFPVSGIKLGD
jgi:CubicO group peptidase (beta-lactamase class C family)